MSLFQGTVIKRGRTVWDRALLPPEEYEERLALVQEKMAALNLQSLLVYGDNSYCGDLGYLSNYSPFIAWREGFLLVPPAGRPNLLVKITPRDLFYVRDFTWADVEASRNLAADCGKRLQDWGVTGTVGLVGGERIPWIFHDDLQKALGGLTTVPADDFYRVLRAVKRPREIAVQSEGRKIVQEALHRLAGQVTAGGNTCEVMAGADHWARRRGCEDVQVLVGGSGAGYTLGPVTSRSLEAGEFLTIFLAVQYQRYWAAGGTTIVVGAGSAAPVDQVREALRQTAAQLRPGLTAARAYADLTRVLQDAARDGWQAFPPGGGIGLDLEEDPVLAADGTSVLERGMVLNLRVMLELAGKPCFASDTYVLEATGVRTL